MKMCLLVTSIDMSSFEHVAAGVCLFDRRYTAKNYWPSKIYIIVHCCYYVIPGIPSHSSLVSSYGTMILH